MKNKKRGGGSKLGYKKEKVDSTCQKIHGKFSKGAKDQVILSF